MSDLQDKFTVLQAQLSGQHVEIGTALDSILVALGAPPSTPATNLTDIAELMAAQHTALLEVLGQVNTNLDTMINNNSLNAQRLLIAIAANDPCRDCATTPIAPPPLDVTPQTVDQEHCKRMQALIYALRRFTVKLDLLSSFGLGFSPTVINDAISEIITELGVSGQLEYPSLGEVAQLAGAGAAYIVSNIFSSTSLPAEFMSVEDSLLLVLYDTDNAADGQAAYRSLLAGSTLDSKVQLLFSAMAYTSIFNLYYDRTIELDLSGYDGTICAPEEVPNPLGCAIDPGYNNVNGYEWQFVHGEHVIFPQTTTGPGYYIPIDPITAPVVVVQLRNFTSIANGYSTYLFGDEDGVLNTFGQHLFGSGGGSPYYYMSGNNRTIHMYVYPQGDGDIPEADVCIWALRLPL